MKVLFFVHRYWPSVGGVEKYVRHLAVALHNRGHEVSVVAGDAQGGLSESELVDGVAVHRFPASRSTMRCRLWLWRHRELFVSADAIQVSNTHMLEYLWRMLGPCLDRRRIFLTRHGFGGVYPVPDQQKLRAQRSLRLAAGFVHDGEFIARWLEVSPDLVPLQGLSPRADELPFVTEPPPTSAIYVGRLEPDTAIQLYVDGVRDLVVAHRRPMTLHVYGGGSMLAALRARVADEQLPILFHGTTQDAQHQIGKHCFAFVNGRMAIQEAMARRRAVIAAYGDPLRKDYICGESFSSYLVAVGSGAELASQVIRLIDQPVDRHKLTEGAFLYARTLNWDVTAGAFENLWLAHGAQHQAPLKLLEKFAMSWSAGGGIRLQKSLITGRETTNSTNASPQHLSA